MTSTAFKQALADACYKYMEYSNIQDFDKFYLWCWWRILGSLVIVLLFSFEFSVGFGIGIFFYFYFFFYCGSEDGGCCTCAGGSCILVVNILLVTVVAVVFVTVIAIVVVWCKLLDNVIPFNDKVNTLFQKKRTIFSQMKYISCLFFL